MTDYGYVRGSTDSQDMAGQFHRLAEAGIPRGRVFADNGTSGMKPAMERPRFAALWAQLVPGDTVTVPELSRIGRSTKDVLATVEDFETAGVGLRILDLALDTTTPTGRMVVTVLAAVARLERDLISERTTAALAARKAAGVKLGGPRKLNAGQAGAVRKMRAAGASIADICAATGVSRATAYRTIARAGKWSKAAATGVWLVKTLPARAAQNASSKLSP